MGLFPEDGCIQTGWVKLGLINYINAAYIHDICTVFDVTFISGNGWRQNIQYGKLLYAYTEYTFGYNCMSNKQQQ